MSALREVLDRVRAAAPGTSLDDIAAGLGLGRDEVDAMVDYWTRRGDLVVDELSSCPSSGCGGCRLRDGGCPTAPSRPGRPALVTIRPRHDPAR